MRVKVIIQSEKESEAVNSRLHFTTLFHIQHMFSNVMFVAEIVRGYLILQ